MKINTLVRLTGDNKRPKMKAVTLIKKRLHVDNEIPQLQAKKSSRELARTVRGQTRSRYARDKSAKLRSDERNIFRTVKIGKKTLARENTRTNAR